MYQFVDQQQSHPVGHRRHVAHAVVLGCLIAFPGCSTVTRPLDSMALFSPPASIDARSLASTRAKLTLERAESAERQGKTDDAIRYYEQALRLDAELTHLSRRLAVLYDQTGDSARALQAYERAVTIQPRNPELLNDFGVYYLHRDQWAAAETLFRRSLAVAPKHQRATTNLATCVAMQNRTGESFELFASVVGPAAAYSNLGVLLIRQGRTDEAREHFHQALARDKTIQAATHFLRQLERQPTSTVEPSPKTTSEPLGH